jgi:phage shock protein C
MAQPPRRIRKSVNEKMLFGVAGGVAEYFNLDPVLIRVGFIALCFAGGAGFVVYLAMAIIMPGPEGPA